MRGAVTNPKIEKELLINKINIILSFVVLAKNLIKTNFIQKFLLNTCSFSFSLYGLNSYWLSLYTVQAWPELILAKFLSNTILRNVQSWCSGKSHGVWINDRDEYKFNPSLAFWGKIFWEFPLCMTIPRIKARCVNFAFIFTRKCSLTDAVLV